MLKSCIRFLTNMWVNILNLIAPERADALRVRTLTETEVARLPKAPDIHGLDWITSLFHYKHPIVKAIIWELKYHENTHPLDLLGRLLFEEILEKVSNIILFDADAKFLLIPIPISHERRLERGFNQSEYVAKSILSHDLEHTLTYAPQYLEKILDTPRQSHSQTRAERMKNLIGCFEADARVAGYYIILIDDVTTTGSTLSEARSTLLSLGARDVFAFTIAH